jgi:hypothetical protein
LETFEPSLLKRSDSVDSDVRSPKFPYRTPTSRRETEVTGAHRDGLSPLEPPTFPRNLPIDGAAVDP